MKCNIVDGGKLAEAKAKLERAKSNRCDVENLYILKRNFSPRVQLGLHYQRKEAAAAAEGASR